MMADLEWIAAANTCLSSLSGSVKPSISVSYDVTMASGKARSMAFRARAALSSASAFFIAFTIPRSVSSRINFDHRGRKNPASARDRIILRFSAPTKTLASISAVNRSARIQIKSLSASSSARSDNALSRIASRSRLYLNTSAANTRRCRPTLVCGISSFSSSFTKNGRDTFSKSAARCVDRCTLTGTIVTEWPLPICRKSSSKVFESAGRRVISAFSPSSSRRRRCDALSSWIMPAMIFRS